MFTKLLVIVLVIVGVWYGWRWVNRVQSVGRERMRDKRREAPAARSTAGGGSGSARGGSARDGAGSSALDAEDMEKCPECGAYVAPRSAVSCGRPACPYGR